LNKQHGYFVKDQEEAQADKDIQSGNVADFEDVDAAVKWLKN